MVHAGNERKFAGNQQNTRHGKAQETKEVRTEIGQIIGQALQTGLPEI